MEQYFQREGRDWERYAWKKARPVAGDIEAGERFLETLRPFVYRRYLDYGALDGLREMKAAIDAEVARKELADDLKRGPGGIREIEFLVQALQLIRGGREPALRERRLLPALAALVRRGTRRRRRPATRWPRRIASCAGWKTACRCCAMRRRTRCPTTELDRAAHRARRWATTTGRRCAPRSTCSARAWPPSSPHCSRRAGAPSAPSDAGDVLARAARWRRRRGAGRCRLRAMPTTLDAQPARLRARARRARRCPTPRARAWTACCRRCCTSAARRSQPDAALRRVLPLLQTILRRASYLALLDEQPAALARLVDVVARSALLAERLAAHPLLLDELLDARVAGAVARSRRARGRVHATTPRATTMPKPRCMALNEVRQALSFRIALADARRAPVRAGQRAAAGVARRCAWSSRVLALAHARSGRARMARSPDARFAVLGYGSLGGEELGFGSDLDLVFLYDAPRRCAVRRRASAGCVALVRAARAEGGRAARHGDAAPAACTTSTCACAPTAPRACWCRASPASPTTSASARGPGNTRRWCARAASPAMPSLRADFEHVRAQTLARPRDAGRGARRRACDAPAHARRTRSQRRGALRPQAGRGRAGRPRIPAAVRACCASRATPMRAGSRRATRRACCALRAQDDWLDARDMRCVAARRMRRCSTRACDARWIGARGIMRGDRRDRARRASRSARRRCAAGLPLSRELTTQLRVPSRARTSAATRAVSRSGSTSYGPQRIVEADARVRIASQRGDGNAARARASLSPPSTNTGTRVAHASVSMFTESAVQTMRSAHASRPG